MVVGKGSYQNTAEAYPLDKKTLRQIALRSFLIRSSFNPETGESVGWLYAMMPGLQKIHTDETDLSLAMGHHLEYVDTGSFFSTLALGVCLSLEQQKADLETIRSVRTTIAAMCKGLGSALFFGLCFPLFMSAFSGLLQDGTVILPVVYFIVMALLSVVLRFVLLTIGYAQGTKVVDKLGRHQKQLKHASRIAGLFMIGVLAVILGRGIEPFTNFDQSANVLGFTTLLNQVLPGCLGILLTLLCYHLLTKKNWSLGKCIALVFIFAMLGSFFGLWQGITATPVSWPWLS